MGAPPPTLRARFAQAAALGRPLVGGHRGNPAQHPENTLAGFRSAIDLGVDLIECDVHMSADGRLIVIHDHTLDRTTDGSGLVASHSAAELRRLDAGGGERLPFLSEVCEMARGRVGVCVELKQLPIAYPELEERVIDELARQDVLDDTAVISFSHSSVARIKGLEPRILGGLLMVSRPLNPAALMIAAQADLFCPHWSALDSEVVNSIHAAGGRVGTWTIDDALALSWCETCQPDSIFTNQPAQMLAEIASRPAPPA